MELIGLLAALALAGTAVGVGSRRSSPPTPQVPTIVYRERSPNSASLRRPAPIPNMPPLGQDARDLLYDAFQLHPGYGASVAAVLAAFRQAEMGYPQQQCDLIDDLLEPDCHLASLFEKRNEAVSGKPSVVQAGSAEPDAELGAKILRDQLATLPMIETLQHLLTFNVYGYACVEIDWGVKIVDGRPWIVPTCFTAVRARRFRISQLQLDGVQDELRLYASLSRPRGDPLRAYKWIVVRRNDSLPVAMSGLMRNCAWPALGKRYGVRDWLVASDKFGKPLPLASYKEDADDTVKTIADEVIRNIGNDVGASMPDSVKVEFKEIKNSEGSKTFGGLIAHCNAEMSKRVNGATLSNDSAGAGSYGLGDVHDAVRWEAVQYDAARIENAFHLQVFAPFMHFNGLTTVSCPRMHIQVVRDLDPTKRIDIATKYVNLLGGAVSASQMGQELGFREPTDDKDKLAGAPDPAAEPMPKTPNPKIEEQT